METPIISQQVCYLSTPEYLNTFWGKRHLVYCRGVAQLTNTQIRYRSKKVNFDLPLASIININIGTFEVTQGVLHLNYLAITFNTTGGPRTVLLVPAESRFTPSWSVNRIIENWFNTICNLKGYKYDTYRPYPFTHDWPDRMDKETERPIKERNDKSNTSILTIIPKQIFTLFCIMSLLVLIAFTVVQGILGFFFGLLLMVFFFLCIYFYYWTQFRIFKFVRENKDKNLLFKMWAEFEEGEFLGPFKKPK